MSGSITLVEAAVLLILMAVLGITAWLFGRLPLQDLSERRLPWLFPASMVRHMEAIACEHPYNYLAMMFFILVGISEVFEALGQTPLSPIVRYGSAVLVAAFALYMSRRNAVL